MNYEIKYIINQAIAHAMNKLGMKWDDNRQRLSFQEYVNEYINKKLEITTISEDSKFEMCVMDLDNCFIHMDDNLSNKEKEYRQMLIELCNDIVEEYKKEEK